MNHLYCKLHLARGKESSIDVAAERHSRSHEVERIYLFGSYARNEATEASDIDLCLETGSTFSLFNAGAFVSALEDSLNIPIDMVSQDGLYEFAYKGYLRDRVLLYERGR